MSYRMGQSYLFRLPPGEDLLVGLYRVSREFNVGFGVFRVTGAVRNATLGHLDQATGELCRQILETGQDLVECSGNVSPQGDSFYIRAYAVMCDPEGQVSAGELLSAQVSDAAEFFASRRERAFRALAPARAQGRLCARHVRPHRRLLRPDEWTDDLWP